jgi:hypothetical protein
MSAFEIKKRSLLLPLLVVALAGGYSLYRKSSATSQEAQSGQIVSKTEAPVVDLPAALETVAPIAANAAVKAPHPVDCAHCAQSVAAKTSESQLSTNPSVDYIFKNFAARSDQTTPLNTFDFRKGSHVGQHVSFQVAGQEYSGVMTVANDAHPLAQTHVLALDDDLGHLTVTTDAGGALLAHLQFFGDSRVLLASKHLVEGSAPSLLVQQVAIADIYCAKKGTIYTATGLRVPGAPAPAEDDPDEFLELLGPASEISLESLPDSEYVIYLDFDGEDVVGTPWLGGALIEADPHERATDDAWITLVWERVSEDFAPFDINVTTDRAVYDAADVTKRLHTVFTPTDDVARDTGGVAHLWSFRNASPVIWVFLDGEYACATAASHEAGHAFSLTHDGDATAEYYGGHNTDYAPGWAAIMGAAYFGEIYDEVDQWSKGEYANASNTEDDLAVISDITDPQASDPFNGISNGFGYRVDDHADAIGTGSSVLNVVGDGLVSGEGLISREGDADVFRFAASEGDIRMVVSSLDVESRVRETGSNTAGSNLAAHMQLLDVTGAVIYEGLAHGANGLSSIIETFVTEGTYYLLVDGIGKGADASVGFSDYASLGQYTISGELGIPPLSVLGGPKQDQRILAGDTVIEEFNGTDFGFITPSMALSNEFLLEHAGTVGKITNLSVSLGSGADFNILSPVADSIDPGSAFPMKIEYAPSSPGTHSDTVIIEYYSGGQRAFEFAIGGTATISETEDNYETGVSAVNAYNLNPVEDTWLSDHLGVGFFLSDNIDWYTFTADAGDGLVTVNTSYDPGAGNVQFELLNWNGTVLSASTAALGNIQFLIPDTYTDLKFYIRVTTTDNNTVRNPYDLKWSSIPLVAGSDDLYEDNDSLDQAYDLTDAVGTSLSEILGPGTLNDDDWYKIDVLSDPFTRMLYVAAEFDNAQGNIDIEVYDTNSNRVLSATTGDREVVTYHNAVFTEDFADNFTPVGNFIIMGVEPGTYYVRVYGDYAGNSYDLTVEQRRDDSYEVVDASGTENDTQANAFPLGESIVGTWLSEIDGDGTSSAYAANATAQNFINRVDDDWYSFSIDDSEIVEQITLEFVSFDGGSMEFSIVNSTGTVLASTDDFIFGIGVLTLDNPVGNSFFIHVVAESGIGALSGYDFRVNFSSAPPFVEDPIEDSYEENDTFQELYDIRANEGRWLSSIDGYGTQLDADWFEINVPGNASKLVATLFHVAAEGDMDLTLSKKDGPVHFVANGGGNTETITWDDPIPGEYALTVTGERRGNFYNLFWDITFSEDNYEENDTQATAFDLTGFERRSLNKLDGTGIQKDDDWFRIAARADTVELRASISFTHADGDIDLAVYNAAGGLIQRSTSSTDNEGIVYLNPTAGDYFVRVYNGDAGNEYDLTWSALSQAELDDIAVGDDAYEENDTISQPYVLDAAQPRLSTLLGNGLQKDEDWFEIELPEGNAGLLVECLFSDAEGDIDFEVYDSLGFPLAVRDSITDNELLFIDAAVPAGTYKIRVYSPGLGNEYDLYWTAFIEDIYEENDVITEAHVINDLTGAPLSNSGVPTQGDDDWYVFDVDTTGNPFIQVTLDYMHINGSVDFTIHNSAGDVLATAGSLNDSETILIPVSLGTHYVCVYGDNSYNPYDLTVEVFGDDSSEENDTSAAAYNITLATTLSLVQFDDDWFKFSVTSRNTFLNIFANFTHANGNIDLAVYRSGDLINPLAVSSSQDKDGEAVSLPGDVGDYYIRVYGDNTNPLYQLTLTAALDDEYEENDLVADATDITAGAGIVLSGIQFDQDWFEIEVPVGSVKVSVDIEFQQAEGDLNLTLYNEAGVELATVDTTTDDESLAVSTFPFGTEPETYFIMVNGQGAGTEYSLVWASSTEDNFEGDTGNNTYSEPSDVLLGTEGLPISTTIGYGGALNDDWYEVKINPGDEGIVIEGFFIHATDNNIDLELYNAEETFCARSVGFSNVERINYKGAAGTYYLRVFGSSGGNAYDLVWNSYKEDHLEKHAEGDFKVKDDTPDNDSHKTPRGLRATAYNSNYYTSLPGGGRPDLEYIALENLTLFDEDWYAVEVFEGEDIFTVDLEFEHAHGDIDVALYHRETEALIVKAETEMDGEHIFIQDLEAGQYLICVYGYGIVTPKSDPDSFDGEFNPIRHNLSDWNGSIQENGVVDYYDLAEANARGLGNSYSLRWISTSEDIYDNEDPDLGVNDRLENSAEPELRDQYGEVDEVVVDPEPIREATTSNSDGEDVTVPYRPVYRISDLAQFDEDWFRIPVNTGGDHQFFATIYFNKLHGDLDLFLYAENGDLIESSTSDGSVESVEANGEGEIPYYLRVVGNDLGVPYTLEVRGFFDDDYEDNETTEEADANSMTEDKDISDLKGVLIPGLVSRDVDIYRIEVPADQVHLDFRIDSPGAAFNIAVLDSTGTALPGGFKQSDRFKWSYNRSAGVIAPNAGTYYLRVSTTDGLAYGLTWFYNNIDQYEGHHDNDDRDHATNLTRYRLQPVYDVDDPDPLPPIKEFGFDYGLLEGLTLDDPAFDPFGHATQGDDDWYAIQIPSWFLADAKKGKESIKVLKRDYYVRLSAEIEFTHVDGDINMEIYDQTNTYPLGRAESAADIESLVVSIDPTDEDRHYYIRVYGDNQSNDYSLKWDVSKQDAYEELEDNFEDEFGVEFNNLNDYNNFFNTAYDLTNVDNESTQGTWLHQIRYLQDVNGDGVYNDGRFTSATGYGMQNKNDDWYAVVVSNGATQITVDLKFYSDNDTGYEYDLDNLDMDFEVYFLYGNDGDPQTADHRRPVLIGRSTEDTEQTLFSDAGSKATELAADITTEIQESATFDVTGTGEGIYFIRVYYDNRSHPYTFMWNDLDADNNPVYDREGDAEIIFDYLSGSWSWSDVRALPSEPLTAPGANADGDQFPNWAEFALGLDTSVAEHSVVSQSIAEFDGKQHYQLEFTRNVNAEGLGYEFIVQESDSLSFGSGRAEHVEDIAMTGTDMERVIYRSTKPIDEQGRCFFRLVVHEPTSTK